MLIEDLTFFVIFAKIQVNYLTPQNEIMSKTVELQIEKGRGLVEGMRKHVKEMGERGISIAEIDQLEQSLNELTAANDEVDCLREELQPKVKHLNEVLSTVKTTYAEAKKAIKGYYPQECWADYGVPDKR